MFKSRIIRPEDYLTSKWSGGETKQIYIYPEDSSYADRNFDYRISSATVELEESDFTILEGYNRYIMTLSGNIRLVHEGYHEIKLTPLNEDYFSGSWKTKCYGKCVDFNLMLKEGYGGGLRAIKNVCTIDAELDRCIGVYSLYDNVDVYELKNGYEIPITTLSKGDMLLIEQIEKDTALIVLVNESVPQGEVIAIGVRAFKKD